MTIPIFLIHYNIVVYLIYVEYPPSQLAEGVVLHLKRAPQSKLLVHKCMMQVVSSHNPDRFLVIHITYEWKDSLPENYDMAIREGCRRASDTVT